MFQRLSHGASSALRRVGVGALPARGSGTGTSSLAVPNAVFCRAFRKRAMVKHTNQQRKPKYKPTPPPEPYPEGHPRIIGEGQVVNVLPHTDTEVWSLNAISRTKDQTRKKYTKPLRDEKEYLTGIINTAGIPSDENRLSAIRIKIPLREWTKIVKENRHMNSVFDVYVDGSDTPIQCITSHYAWDYIEGTPLNVMLLRFEEGRKYRIHMYAEYENYADAETLRKGGLFKEFTPPDGWKMYWKGSREIPRSFSCDLLHTKIDYNYKLLNEFLPEGLTYRQPHRTESGRQHYVLATIKGKLKRGETEAEE